MTTSPNAPLMEASYIAMLHQVQRDIDNKNFAEAAKRLNSLVSARPSDPRIYLLGSKLAEANGHADGMLKAAEKVVALAPDWLPGITHLAAVLITQGKRAEALSVVERGYKLARDSADALKRLITVAHAARAYELSQRLLERVERLEPTSQSVKLALARNLAALGRHAESLDQLNQLLITNPDDMAMVAERARGLILAGRPAEAKPDADRLIDSDPNNPAYRFIAQLASGQIPDRQPAELIQSTFDGYAADYDQHLVTQLRYQLPKRVAERIFEWFPERRLNVLDLGCGTGLLGVCLGRIGGALIGVDLSAEMLERAAAHNVYDRLHHTDLLDAVRETPDSLYQVIAACDVLIYVGDLASVVTNAHRILVPGGYLVFSVEALEDSSEDFTLEPTTLRYRHHANYLHRLVSEAGFAEGQLEIGSFRQQGGQPVKSYLVVARKA